MYLYTQRQWLSALYFEHINLLYYVYTQCVYVCVCVYVDTDKR